MLRVASKFRRLHAAISLFDESNLFHEFILYQNSLEMYDKLVGGGTSLAFGLVKSARLLPRLLLCHLANAKKLRSLVTVLGGD